MEEKEIEYNSLRENYKLSLINCTNINDELLKQKTEITDIKLQNEKQLEQNIILSNKINELQNKLNVFDNRIKHLINEKNQVDIL